MAGFRSITPNITINTESGPLRTELLNTFSRLDGQLALAPYRIFTQNGSVSNVSTGETDLMTTTINFGTLNQVGSSIVIWAWGTTNANANNKTLKMVLGSTTLFTSGAIALNNKDWVFRGEIVFSSGTSQLSFGEFVSNGSAAVVDVNSGSENFGTNLILKLTGTGGATGDIAVSFWKGVLIK